MESTIASSAVNGGQIATSTPSTSETRGSSPAMNSSASATVLCIFQLPAISGVRPLMNSPRGPPPRQLPCPRSARTSSAALHPRSTGASHDLCRSRTGLQRRRRVAAADDGDPRRVGDRLRRPSACPAANGASSKAPIGPFQKTVPARAIDRPRRPRRCRARRRGPSSPRVCRPRTPRCDRRVGAEVVGDEIVGRQLTTSRGRTLPRREHRARELRRPRRHTATRRPRAPARAGTGTPSRRR